MIEKQIKIIDDIYKYVQDNPNIGILKITICDENKIIFSGIIKKLREIKYRCIRYSTYG